MLREILATMARDFRTGKNIDFSFLTNTMHDPLIYRSIGRREGRAWHDGETIEVPNGPRLYIFRGDGIYNPEACRRALLVDASQAT